jgi:hypothetical protein
VNSIGQPNFLEKTKNKILDINAQCAFHAENSLINAYNCAAKSAIKSGVDGRDVSMVSKVSKSSLYANEGRDSGVEVSDP